MDIPDSILKEHLIPKDYYKPKIEIQNYYLKWNDESYGIPQKEISELKRFVTNAIPFFDMSYEVMNNFEKPRYKDKYRLYKELSPRICISHTKLVEFCIKHNIRLLAYGTICGGLMSERFLGKTQPPSTAELNTLSLRKYKKMIDAWGG